MDGPIERQPDDAPDGPRPCDFGFLCSMQWNELRPTFAADVRYCDNCKRDVFRITSRAQLEEARASGRCVAWARPESSRASAGPSMLVGDPVMAPWLPNS
ncbi:hypothetical protein QTI66_17405 [Variovorax sp. J22R133]|uniref:hypothetical protein n=1 Tax=Variovorax brevis TaxID=3053503 RepID=UPI0025767111|nr:hypothetical protein [Variovorax sp. J22R133]MDM0113935.1 hypothetical protein [Variovorax sp. J22R133]